MNTSSHEDHCSPSLQGWVEKATLTRPNPHAKGADLSLFQAPLGKSNINKKALHSLQRLPGIHPQKSAIGKEGPGGYLCAISSPYVFPTGLNKQSLNSFTIGCANGYSRHHMFASGSCWYNAATGCSGLFHRTHSQQRTHRQLTKTVALSQNKTPCITYLNQSEGAQYRKAQKQAAPALIQ